VALLSDCPIQPHVWREFRGRMDSRLELICHVRADESAAEVAVTLRDWLPSDTRESINSIFAFDVYVLIDVDFDGVVTALLPLTGWADLLRRVSTLSRTEIDIELSAVRSDTPTASVSATTMKLSHEDYGRLRWLLAQIVAAYDSGPSVPLTSSQVVEMIGLAVSRAPRGPAPLLSVGYNRWVEPAVAVSRRTIKADAAESLFDVDCSDIRWAVVDTGADTSHAMFGGGRNGAAHRVVEAFDIPEGIARLKADKADDLYAGIATDADWKEFRAAATVPAAPPAGRPDRFAAAANDHGTHVAGILAGRSQLRDSLEDSWQANVRGDEPEELRGICPTLNLVDVRVFDEQGRGREFEVVIALAFLRWLCRREPYYVHGANISLSIPFAVDNFACGWTPVCIECDRLVSDGVVVVVSAGNSGYDDSRGTLSIGAGFQMVSIADPGNADSVITVGATHRTDPHRYGPISRSARGPTADGRHKPDLLAPGDGIWGPVPNGGWGRKSGTSQAAPHVSGVAALVLARNPELRGRPDRVKEILCETATDLQRLVDFQGHGLVDALRALQRP